MNTAPIGTVPLVMPLAVVIRVRHHAEVLRANGCPGAPNP
jgi:hypothetical protein